MAKKRTYRKTKKVAKPVKKYVKKEIMKSAYSGLSYVDVTTTNQNISYDSTYVQNLTLIDQGTNIGHRVGNKIGITGIEIRMFLDKQQAVATSAPALVRLALVRSMTDVAPGWGSVYTATGFNSTDVLGFRKQKNTRDYHVLKEWVADLGYNDNVTWNDKNCKYINYKKKWKTPQHCQFASTTSTDIAYGQLYLIACSNYLAASTEPRILLLNTRVHYQQ